MRDEILADVSGAASGVVYAAEVSLPVFVPAACGTLLPDPEKFCGDVVVPIQGLCGPRLRLFLNYGRFWSELESIAERRKELATLF